MKTDNSQKRPGRPEKINKSVPINWRCPHKLYYLIEHERKKQEFIAKRKVPMSKVLEGLVKKSLY